MFDRKFLKFIIVGIINTIVGSTIMFSLYNFAHFSYWTSSAANYILTSILSFFLNKYFTFQVKHWSYFMVISFILTISISYLLAYGIAQTLINQLLHDSPQSIRENLSLFIGMCLFVLLNYTGQRFIAFNTKAPHSKLSK